MSNSIKSESDDKIKFIEVNVLNKPSDGYENFYRTATGDNTGSLLRKAIFTYSSNEFELGFKDDLGKYNFISKMFFDNISEVKHNPKAISSINQLLKPALKGFFIGCGILLFAFLTGKLAVGLLGMIGLIAFTTVFFSLGTLFNMEKKSIIIIEGSNSDKMDFAINRSSFILFSKLMKEKNIEITIV